MNNVNASPSYRFPGWFQGAPLTKLLTFSTIGFFAILKDNQDLIALDLQDLVEHREFYRLILYPLTFQSIGETIMGLTVLVPLCKRFEREMGSVKMVAFMLKSFVMATILQCFLLSDKYLATGPYPTIGAILYLYHSFTPRLYPKFVSILGFDFSEKALTQLFVLQLVFHHGYYSLVPFIAGYISGLISISKITPYGRWDLEIPGLIYRIGYGVAKATGLEDLSHAPSYISHQRNLRGSGGRRNNGSDTDMRRNGDFGANNNNAQTGPGQAPGPQFEPTPLAQPPSEENIEQLTAMGFERDAVVRALREADNNLEHAANRLLTGM